MDTTELYNNEFVATFPMYVLNTGVSRTPICINGMVCLFTEGLYAERLGRVLDLDEYEVLVAVRDQGELDDVMVELFDGRAIGVLFDPWVRPDGKFMGFQKALC